MPKVKSLPKRYQLGFLSRMDCRTEVAWRLNTAYSEIIDDAGGKDNLTHVQLRLIENFVFLEELLEEWMERMVKGDKNADENISRWIQALNQLLGLAKVIPGGMKKLNKKVDLKAYTARRGA